MRARIVKIGNSRGIRLPKPVMEQVGLTEEVTLEVQEGTLVISPSERPRGSWAAAAKALSARGDEPLLDAPTPTRFDEEEWEW